MHPLDMLRHHVTGAIERGEATPIVEWRPRLHGTPQSRDIMRKVREAIREPYAWPGGYPVYTVMRDGELLCATCARENYRLISMATHDPCFDLCWAAAGADIYWVGPTEYCAHCNGALPSAFGDPDTEETES